MTVIERWIAYPTSDDEAVSVAFTAAEADEYRARGNIVEGPFVPAEQLATAVSALGEVLALVDDALDTWTFARHGDYRRVTKWLGRVHAIATNGQPRNEDTK